MAWTAPMTAVANAVFTAAQFNTHVRDNLLETSPAKATTAGSYFVTNSANSIEERLTGEETQSTSGNTTSTSYVTALTSGTTCDVTLDVGVIAVVIIRGTLHNATAASNTTTMSYEITGASGTIAAADSRSVSTVNTGTVTGNTKQGVFYHSGLTPGSHTFTLQHKVSAGTGHFANRQLIVLPF